MHHMKGSSVWCIRTARMQEPAGLVSKQCTIINTTDTLVDDSVLETAVRHCPRFQQQHRFAALECHEHIGHRRCIHTTN